VDQEESKQNEVDGMKNLRRRDVIAQVLLSAPVQYAALQRNTLIA